MPRPPAIILAREELQHQAIDLGRVLVGGPVAASGNAVHVERADGLADLADQEVRGPEGGIVALAPEEPDSTGEPGKVTQQRPARAHLAAVEASSTDAVRLDIDRLLGDAPRIAEHVDEQVVATDLPEQPLVVAGLPIAPDGPFAEASWREAGGRDQTQMRHSRSQAPGEMRGDGPAEREPGEP